MGHVFEYDPAVHKMRQLVEDGQNGLRVVKVLEAAQESLNNRGGPLEMNL